MHIESQINHYLAEHLLFRHEPEWEDLSLTEAGLIDSITLMELVAYVSSEFSIVVAACEVIPENFDSVKKLADFIRRKKISDSRDSALSQIG